MTDPFKKLIKTMDGIAQRIVHLRTTAFSAKDFQTPFNQGAGI